MKGKRKNHGTPKERSRLATTLRHAAEQGTLRQLLEWLFTPAECAMFSQRIAIAERLASGWSYRMIEAELRVSQATIAALHRALSRVNPTYRRIFSLRYRKQQKHESVFTEHRIPFSLKDLITRG